MRITTIFIITLFFYTLNAQETKKTTIPDWVVNNKVPANINSTSNKEDGAYTYLLIDFQDNLINEEQYAHYIVKVLNSQGISEMSDISVSFDPAFQTLRFHSAKIIRKGETINKLSNTRINTFQRETNLERSLYDGSLTSVLNLTDVREGDIIEYSYTIKGFNPVNKGNYSGILYQQYSLPVHRIYSRLVTNRKNDINYKLFYNAKEPEIINSELGKEYIWNTSGLENVVYDVNVPHWYDTQKRISVSTFDDWKEVVNLIEPLYSFSKNKIDLPISINKELDSKQDIIIKLIRFVQDEIRYLGFEAGIGAYKPNKPDIVLSRRYGDCKDKSLLLSSLLQNEDIEAYPILVNTQVNKNLNELLPGHNIFNHCIVYFKHEGKGYFIDPTISNQGGDLYHLSTPDYNFGLVLNSKSKNLITIPKPKRPSLRIVEDIVVDSIGGNATFSVKTEYFGSRADFMRSYFKNNTEKSINKEYLNFYSSLYPTIMSMDIISFEDNARPWENIFTTHESYLIEPLWSPIQNTDGIYFETYPLILENLVNYTKSAKREMPYYVGTPYSFEQLTRITLPEPWLIKEETKTIEDDAFQYSKQIRKSGNIVSLNYKYKTRKEVIDGNAVSTFLSKNNEVRQQLGFQFTYDNSSDGFNLSWISLLITLTTFIASIFLAIKLYKKHNPKPENVNKPKSIGGWLILPAIGLVLTPFNLIFQLFSSDYFHKDIWYGFQAAGYKNSEMLNIYIGFELFANISFLVFTILLIILFFKKRTNSPILMVYFYGTNLGLILIGSFIINQFGIDDSTLVKDLFGGIIGAVIWIPYFMNSTRVKDTFVTTYKNKYETVSNIKEKPF
ncbi:DUF2569 family protein [Maribacter sp. 2304DJ31-5]|uniref:DUF2569 family protein n=1 Tax=Maribacter sp. 2304DJ31-5 TaxID=3386273 RepID=UPI0039BD27C7